MLEVFKRSVQIKSLKNVKKLFYLAALKSRWPMNQKDKGKNLPKVIFKEDIFGNKVKLFKKPNKFIFYIFEKVPDK